MSLAILALGKAQKKRMDVEDDDAAQEDDYEQEKSEAFDEFARHLESGDKAKARKALESFIHLCE